MKPSKVRGRSASAVPPAAAPAPAPAPIAFASATAAAPASVSVRLTRPPAGPQVQVEVVAAAPMMAKSGRSEASTAAAALVGPRPPRIPLAPVDHNHPQPLGSQALALPSGRAGPSHPSSHSSPSPSSSKASSDAVAAEGREALRAAEAVESKGRLLTKVAKGKRGREQQRKAERGEEAEDSGCSGRSVGGGGPSSSRSGGQGCNAVLAADVPSLAASIAWTKPRAAKKQRTAEEGGREDRAALPTEPLMGSLRSRLEDWASACRESQQGGPSSNPSGPSVACPAFLAQLSRSSDLLRQLDFAAAARSLRNTAAAFPPQAEASAALHILLAYAEEQRTSEEGEEGADSRACAAFARAVECAAQPAGELLEAFHSFERRRVNRALHSGSTQQTVGQLRHSQPHSHHSSSTASHAAPLTPSARLAAAAAPPMTPLSALLRKYRTVHPLWADEQGQAMARAADAPFPPATPRSAALRERWTIEGEEEGEGTGTVNVASTAPTPTPRSAKLRQLRLTPESFEAPKPSHPQLMLHQPQPQLQRAAQGDDGQQQSGLGAPPSPSLPPTAAAAAAVEVSSRGVQGGQATTAGDEGGCEGEEEEEVGRALRPVLARSLMDDWLEAERERADVRRSGGGSTPLTAGSLTTAASSAQPPRSPLLPLPLVICSPLAERSVTAVDRSCEPTSSHSPLDLLQESTDCPPSLFVEEEFIAGLSTPRYTPHQPPQSRSPPPASPTSALHSLLPSSHGHAQRLSPASLQVPTPTCTGPVAAASVPASSVVLLQPLRAGLALRQSLGADFFLSPVRRSTRHLPLSTTEGASALPTTEADVARLLRTTDFAFLPNTAAQRSSASAPSQSHQSTAERRRTPHHQQSHSPHRQTASSAAAPSSASSSIDSQLLAGMDSSAEPSPPPLFSGLSSRRLGTPVHRRSSFALLPPPPLQHPTLIVLQPRRPPPPASAASAAASASASAASTSASSPSPSSSPPSSSPLAVLGFASPVRRSARHLSDWAASEMDVRAKLLSGQIELRANGALGEREGEWKQSKEQREERDRQLMPPPPPRWPSRRWREEGQEEQEERSEGEGVEGEASEVAAAPAGRFEGGKRHSTPRPGKRRSRTSSSGGQQRSAAATTAAPDSASHEVEEDGAEEPGAGAGRRQQSRTAVHRRRSMRIASPLVRGV